MRQILVQATAVVFLAAAAAAVAVCRLPPPLRQFMLTEFTELVSIVIIHIVAQDHDDSDQLQHISCLDLLLPA